MTPPSGCGLSPPKAVAKTPAVYLENSWRKVRKCSKRGRSMVDTMNTRTR